MTMAYVFGRWDAASRECAAAPDIPSDEVFRRIANGDRLAMRTLFARYRVSLYRWLLRSLGDAALAESLLNDVFLDVWRNAPPSTGALPFRLGCWRLQELRRCPHAGASFTSSTMNSRSPSPLRQTNHSFRRRGADKKCCAILWRGYHGSTVKSSTSSTTTASPSRKSLRLSVRTSGL
jgi:hypothetical protein